MFEEFDSLIDNPVIIKSARIIIGVAIIWVIVRIIQRYLLVKIKSNDSRYRAKKFSSFAGYFFTILLLLAIYSDKLGTLSIALGVAGAGITFALQEVITSFAGWLAVMFGNFYKTGDRIQLGGITGDVMDVGILRTTIMETGKWVDGDLYNGRIVFIANSFVFKEPVYNYSGDFPFLWDEIKIPVQFGSNYKKAEEILKNIGEDVAGELTTSSEKQWKHLQIKYKLEDASTKPMVSMIVNDNWAEFTLRYVVDYKRRRITKTELFYRLLRDIENTNGEVRLASATFQIVDPPEIKVRINS